MDPVRNIQNREHPASPKKGWKAVRTNISVLLLIFWVLWLVLEILVWSHEIRVLFFPYHPVSDMIFNVLNDTVWLPVAFAMPLYLALLLSRVTKYTAIKWGCYLAGIALFVAGLSNPGRFFMYLVYLVVPFFALSVYHVVTFRKMRVHLLILAGVVLLLVAHYRLQMLPNLRIQHSKNTIKVMSYNILVNQYGRKRQETIDLIRKEQPDVVFLQEINVNDRVLLNHALRDIYPYQVWSEKAETYNGGVIFTRFPLLDKKNYDIETPFMKGHINLNHAIIDYQGKPVHLFNCHLYNSANLFLGFLLRRMDYAQFLTRATNAQNRHRTEATKISELVLPINEPLILAGDFNDTPNSTTYDLYAGTLQNAFAKAGWGLGGTFGYMSLKKSVPPKYRFLLFDFLRIDHVFCSKHFTVRDAKVLPIEASDHRPQIVEIHLK